MFLRSDYQLMVDNSRKLALHYETQAAQYEIEAQVMFGQDRNDHLLSAKAFQERAIHHGRDAEYWMTIIAQFEEPVHVD